MHTFEQLEIARHAHNERADCCVKALAVSRQISYMAAHKMCAKWGRKNRQGMYNKHIYGMFQTEYNAERLPEHEMDRLRQSIGVKNLTPNNIGKALQRCGYGQWRFFALVRRHAFGIDQGQVIDWTEGRKHQIFALIPVQPEPKQEAPKLERKMRHKKARRLGVDPKTGLPMVWAA